MLTVRCCTGDQPDDTHGSARSPPAGDRASGAITDGLLIGRDIKTGKLLRYDGPAHLLTMAPTRTGKGVGTIIPNLLTADRSVICIDPKGENARIAGRARHRFGPVYVLDPFGVTGQPSAAFNPSPISTRQPRSRRRRRHARRRPGLRSARRSRRGPLERGSQGADRRNHPLYRPPKSRPDRRTLADLARAT